MIFFFEILYFMAKLFISGRGGFGGLKWEALSSVAAAREPLWEGEAS